VESGGLRIPAQRIARIGRHLFEGLKMEQDAAEDHFPRVVAATKFSGQKKAPPV